MAKITEEMKLKVVSDMRKFASEFAPNTAVPGVSTPTGHQWIDWFLKVYLGEAKIELIGEPKDVIPNEFLKYSLKDPTKKEDIN